jgi:hypothetical protein
MTKPHFRQIASKHTVHCTALKPGAAGVTEMLKGDLDLERAKYDAVYLKSVSQFLHSTLNPEKAILIRSPDIFAIFRTYIHKMPKCD